MRTVPFARTLVGLCAAAVVSLPTAASAEQWTHRDATGDVVEVTVSESGEQVTRVPEDTTTDIRRLSVSHAPRQLRISMRVEDVVGGDRAAAVRIRTSAGRNFDVVRFQSPQGSSLQLSRRRDGAPVQCREKSGSINASTDTVSITIPRRCLGAPRWVQVGVGYLTLAEGFDGSMKLDDALRNTFSMQADLRLGPRLHRG